MRTDSTNGYRLIVADEVQGSIIVVVILRDPFEGKEYCFGVHMAPVGDFETLKENCLNAEKLGYDLVTVWDHLLTPSTIFGVPVPPMRPMECWAFLAGLAAATEKIQLGSLVSCVHFRHPTILAKMAVTVDIISGGRLILGLGAGWQREEFESFLGGFPSLKERMDGLEDAAIICKSMLEEEYTDYHGKLYSAKDIPRERSMPSPARGFVPIMIGGSGEKRTLKIAAKYADIVHFGLPSHPRLLESKLEVLKNHCETVGRDVEEITLSAMLYPWLERSVKIMEAQVKRLTFHGFSESDARETVEMTTGVDNIVETVKLCRDVGIKLFTIYSGFNPAHLETFKKEVIMKL
jgi:alkanesulfonate monooxygenase SsuD/methylene tetrahydromethanopterin reductase-like flavin-dependent oxidoreductase (luciferase family)